MERSERRGGVWVAVALVAAATVALYAPTLAGGFLADDVFYLRTLSVEDGALAGAFTGPLLGSRETAFYRPLPLASFAVDLALWGTDRALGFRLVNLLLHLLNALLVGAITARVLAPPRAEAPAPGAWAPERALPAVLAGALFALHPLAPEAVAWISGRFDLLATFFSLLALRLAIAGLDGLDGLNDLDGLERGGQSKARLTGGLALVSFAAALASKESAIGLPLAVAAWAGFRERNPTGAGAPADGRGAARRAWVACWPFVAVAATYLALRLWALGALVGGYRDAPLEWWQKEFWAVRLLAVLALVVPHPLLYEVPKKLVLCLLAYPTLGGAAVAVLRRRSPAARRGALFAAIWLVAALAPHFPVLALRPTLENARILYLSAAPFALLAAAVLAPSSPAAAGRPGWISLASLAATGALVAGAAGLLAHNMAPWIEAGKTSRALRQEVTELARTLPAGRRAVVGEVPDHLAGALVLRNGEALARAPFLPSRLDGRVELRVGEPPAAGEPATACGSPDVAPFRWEPETRSVVPVRCH